METKKHLEKYKLFSKLLTHIPMICYVLDTNWIFLLSDGKGLQKLGLKPGQVVGMSAKEIYQEYPDVIEAIEQAYQGNDVKYNHQIGELFLENYVAPFYNELGEVEGVIGATIDITKRTLGAIELDKTRALYEALMESLPGILYLYNEKGELVFWNKSHEGMSGYSKEEIDRSSLMDWFRDDPISQQAVILGLENTTKYGFGEAEVRLRCKDGSTIPLYMTASPVNIDGKEHFVGVGVDISSRIVAETKLHELNHTLEYKVEQRTLELQNANEDLALANEELIAMNDEIKTINEELTTSNEELFHMQKFLVESEKMAALGSLVAGVAHEVNTPIGVGLTASSFLSDISNELTALRKERPLTDEDIKPFLEDIDKASQIIYKNLNRAAKLIQSFKKLSVDQTTEPIRHFEIGAYIEEILLSLSPSLKKTKIKIITKCNETIFMDGYPGSIAQIITNLVMNSLKHAFKPDEVGNIIIEVKRYQSMIRIIFSDDGVGMDSQTLSKIFEPFFTTNRADGGTGLGLAIVYSIVTQQNEGSIRCISNLKEGTTFEIDIKGDVK